MASCTTSKHGYPSPGPQKVSADEVMKNVYFMSQDEWEKDRKCGDFDYVVVGSSFCALGFTQHMLEKNPEAKILIIERGEYFHPEHVQNFPPGTSDPSETFHWSISEKTHNGEYIKWLHGMNNFFGGRSAFWRAWCPEPTREEMENWPESIKDTVKVYFPAAAKLLNVIPAKKIGAPSEGTSIFGELQEILVEKLKSCPPEAITSIGYAQLAVKADMYSLSGPPRAATGPGVDTDMKIKSTNSQYEDFHTYSVAGPLLNLLLTAKGTFTEKGKQPLKIMTGCLVEKIEHKCGRAVALQTNKGNFCLGNAKLILAMGTLPPTTLMLNSFSSSSFEQLTGIGTRFTAHFISSVTARVPVDTTNMYHSLIQKIRGKVEMAAVYIAGVNPESKHQFHIQLSAIIDETPVENTYDTMRHLPNVVAVPTWEQLTKSKNPPHIVFVCASLGQLDHANKDNWYHLNDDEDITSNATLQVVANDIDNQLWDTMDDSTFAVLEKLDPRDNQLDPDDSRQLEYWHSDSQSWKKERPLRAQIRLPGLVHGASTMWIGDDESSPVDQDYQFRGVDNVYLTGGALWPTGASWNPTCVMTALAMDLADKLNNKGT